MHRSTLADNPSTRQLIDFYVRLLPQRVAALEQLLADQQLESLGDIAHQLKGSGGGYGFAPITALAAAVEQSVKENADLSAIGTRVAKLIEYIEQVDG